MLDRKLIDYLPPVLQNVAEFAAITDAEQPEIEAAWDALGLVMDNQFIDSATEQGVALWERELGITPLASDTLADRKQRLKLAWALGVVYTYTVLSRQMSELGGRADLHDYTLRIDLPLSANIAGISLDLSRILPANISASYTGTTKNTASVGIYAVCKSSITVRSGGDPSYEDNYTILTDESGEVLLDSAGDILCE